MPRCPPQGTQGADRHRRQLLPPRARPPRVMPDARPPAGCHKNSKIRPRAGPRDRTPHPTEEKSEERGPGLSQGHKVTRPSPAPHLRHTGLGLQNFCLAHRPCIVTPPGSPALSLPRAAEFNPLPHLLPDTLEKIRQGRTRPARSRFGSRGPQPRGRAGALAKPQAASPNAAIARACPRCTPLSLCVGRGSSGPKRQEWGPYTQGSGVTAPTLWTPRSGATSQARGTRSEGREEGV